MSPQLPWGTVRGRATGVWADGTDEDLNPDLTVLEGLTVTLQPMIPAIVWHGDGGPTTHVPSPVVCQFDDEGYLVSPAQGSSEREVRLLASRHEQIEPSPWDWQLSWSLEEIPSTRFQLEAGQTLDLSSIILSSLAPASPELFHDLLEAAQHLETVLPDVQTARDEAVAARDVAVPAADRAEQARDATLTAATWTLTGPGRPDQPATTGGIITGSEPVGTDYRSTDGAGVGAWAWRRRPSGWAYTDFDTGWRDATGMLGPLLRLSSTAGQAIIRRQGDLVSLRARLEITEAHNINANLRILQNILSGFRLSGYSVASGVSFDSYPSLATAFASAVVFDIRNPDIDRVCGAGAGVAIQTTWTTTDPLPAASTIPPPA